jgi:hypothetical protein
VIAREAVLNDPSVVKLLRTGFVPIALDNVDQPQLTAAEKEFLQDKGLKFCTQGMSVFTAGGKVLALGGGYEPRGVERMLREALDKFRPEDGPVIVQAVDEKDRKSIRKPPEGGLVLYVTWKVVGGYDKPESSGTSGNGSYDKVFQRSLGVDRLWVRKDEAVALAAGRFPESLKKRMLPHLNYATPGKADRLETTLCDGRLSGTLHADSADEGRLLGFVEARDGKVTRFDVIVKGPGVRRLEYGFSASLTVVPAGEKVPVAVLFRLADPKDDLALVPPLRANHDGYLR